MSQHWTTPESNVTDGPTATAADVNGLLARFEVAEIPVSVVPYLAAAAAELALLAGIAWRFSSDDPPVALLRLIAKVTMSQPDVGGPHTERLLAQLSGSAPPAQRVCG